jgi:hypothetical protein
MINYLYESQLFKFNFKKLGARGVAQVIECLPSKLKALSSSSSPAKKEARVWLCKPIIPATWEAEAGRCQVFKASPGNF